MDTLPVYFEFTDRQRYLLFLVEWYEPSSDRPVVKFNVIAQWQEANAGF